MSRAAVSSNAVSGNPFSGSPFSGNPFSGNAVPWRTAAFVALGLTLGSGLGPIGSAPGPAPVWAQSRHAQARHGRSPAGRSIWDREAQRLHDEVVRNGRSARGIVPLVELGSAWERSPTRTLALLHALGENRRLLPSLRTYARGYEAVLLRRSGQLERAEAVSTSLGFVRRWRMLGPFSNEGRRGFDTLLPPERALERATDLDAEHQGTERPVRWRTLPALAPGESVPITPFVTPATDACVLLETFVRVDRARRLSVLVGATGAVRVYWNGLEALADPAYRRADIDRVAAAVEGRAGPNRILVKVCGTDQGLDLLLRVAEADGTPLALDADPEGTLPSAAGPTAATARPPVAPVTPFASLEADIAAHPDDAAAHEALGRYLAYTGGDDPSQPRARDLAIRATELHATPRNALFASRQATSRAERMRHVLRAVALAPNDPEVRVAHARLVGSGPGAERALRMLEAIPADTTAGLTAMGLRARLLWELNLHQSSIELRREVATLVPGAPAYLRILADAEDALGHGSRANELRREVLAIHTDDWSVRRRLAAEAFAEGDREAAVAMIQRELAWYPTSAPTMYWAAGMFDALSDESEALDLLRAAVDLDPDDANAHVVLGRFLLRLERPDAALASLRTALALRPQDAATRQLIEHIEPEARPDERYATPIESILARRRPDGQWPATTLHDLEVHTVHDNGLSSTFRQLVMQIHDREGAEAARSHAIQYEPGTQWVDIRAARVHRGDEVLSAYRVGERSLADPAYRIYYSARQVIVTFPPLEPGDVIELRYRVEDVAARNAYGGYFGAMRGLQRATPVTRLEQVFITPASRELFFNTPSIAVAHERSVDGAMRIDRFSADAIPALRSEPSMPGYSEVAPYLHVSTYPTWEEVGRFWWGLSQPQLAADAALERTVHELIDGAPDVRTRVQRIFAWAIDHVRYVGLEFGIHGHQPYRVTDVVRRGFGDCKDTAALLYTMLNVAGIEARIALVRTRRNGEIGREPASLAIFDHAVAYVPELDLYLDGTAEHAGSTELPAMDRAAMALVVGPSSAELRTLPLGTVDESGRSRELSVTLAADGTATLSATEELRGPEAMQARATYDAAGTREERLTRALGSFFPGIEVDRVLFEHLDDRERPVHYTWGGRVARFGERQGATLRVAPSVLGGLTSAWAPLTTRRHALVLGHPFHYRERRALSIGALRAQEVPTGGVAESEFGRASVHYTTSGNQVVAETVLSMARERVTPAEYPRFRAWVERVDGLLRERIVIGGLR